MTKEELEKEAEKYVIKKHHIDKTKLPIDFSLRCEFSDDFTDFQKGAEFGYQKGIKAKINTTTISDYPIKDSWHEQSTDDIYDFIAKDWSLKYFICIMKDKSRVTATGICDEDYNGGVSTYLDFGHDDEKYSSDDIAWWKEIGLPEE